MIAKTLFLAASLPLILGVPSFDNQKKETEKVCIIQRKRGKNAFFSS